MTEERDFTKRMFVYNDRIFDQHDRPVVSLAVVGEPVTASHGEFIYERWGFRMGLRYPVVSLASFDEERRMRLLDADHLEEIFGPIADH